MEDLKKIWLQKYDQVPTALQKMSKVKTVATAFNANIDAVLKISAAKLVELVKATGLSLHDLQDIKRTRLEDGSDVIKGIFKCFSRGIAEEWLTEDKKVYDWMVKNLGYDRLQMGGQGGIVANVMAVVGVEKVLAHANSLPKLQAEQFVALENLRSFDEKGEEKVASKINRKADIPLIHWIIEFDKNDVVTIEGQSFSCPKSNRFIATYDPLNLNLVMDEAFVKATQEQPLDCVILSGFHALTANNQGVELQDKVLPLIKSWQKNGAIVHLEVASTQDIAVRKAIIKKIASKVDSIGINEREAMDILEIIGQEKLARECEESPHSVNLFRALLAIKQHIKAPRIQLHMFGLYMTLQDKNARISSESNLKGMMLAATVAAGKAGTGDINSNSNLLWAQGKEVSDIGLFEMKDLAEYLRDENLARRGTSNLEDFDLIVIPTILVEKPLTLVGMGDTISSLSLVGSI